MIWWRRQNGRQRSSRALPQQQAGESRRRMTIMEDEAMTERRTDNVEKRPWRRERATWRLDPSNYDFLDAERRRMGLNSMNAALNVVLAEHQHRCRHIDRKLLAL